MKNLIIIMAVILLIILIGGLAIAGLIIWKLVSQIFIATLEKMQEESKHVN